MLKQRNALLKSLRGGGVAVSSTDVGGVGRSVRQGSSGARGRTRMKALAALMPYAQGRYMEVAGGGALNLAYKSSWLLEDLAGGASKPRTRSRTDELRAAVHARASPSCGSRNSSAGCHSSDPAATM